MSGIKQIPVIDLFAGPGGLAEGFSSVLEQGERNYDIRLSVEKDENAHKTLQFRSFYRQFPVGEAPEDYYKVLWEKDLSQREIQKEQLFEKYKSESEKAKEEAWHAELGGEDFPESLVDIGNQEPGSEKSIAEGCLVNYGVTFPMFSKLDVNGSNAHPIFKFLKSRLGGLLGSRIKWNFTKFLVDKNGIPVKRFSPTTTPEKIDKYLEKIV